MDAKFKLQRLLMLLFLIIQIIGCAVPSTSSRTEEGDKIAGAELKSDDGQSQVILPEGWQSHRKLNDAAELQTANLGKNLYLIVLTSNKEDFGKITIKEFSNSANDDLLQTMASPEVKAPKKLRLDGHSAIQSEIKGVFNSKTHVHYLNTVVETDKNFYQLLAWTIEAGFDKNRAELEQIINSFHELKGTSVKPPAHSSEKKPGGIIKTVDGGHQIMLPIGWAEYPKLSEDAELQAANKAKQLYAAVFAENKEEVDNASLEAYSAITKERLLQTLTSPEVKGPTKLTINGHHAVQYEIKGLFNNIKLGYLNTVVEIGKGFHQIIVWTPISGFENSRAEFQRMINSFKESSEAGAKLSSR